jgi:hypothetical protein
MERYTRQAENTTQRIYPEKPEQLSESQHTQCPERGIFSSKEGMRRKIQAIKRANHKKQYSRHLENPPVGVKGSARCCRLFHTFGSTSRGTFFKWRF